MRSLLDPLMVTLSDLSPAEFVDYLQQSSNSIDAALCKYGAIKFSGVRIDSTYDFRQIVNATAVEFLNYIDGNSPRIKLIDNIYTSTEYDKTKRITMHNELSYTSRWPGRLYFSCLQPSESGGETLLANSRQILEVMNPSITAEIRRKGIKYIRNLHGGQGMGPTWQKTFETENQQEVTDYCTSHGIKYAWTDFGQLRLEQDSPGILRHRVTNEELWFNQLDQFHPSHLGEELYGVMTAIYETPENFPTYVEFGDGTPIPPDMVEEVIATIDEVTIAPVWQKHQFLVLDNELVCHGRNSYTGDRSVIVAMSK
ncbi:Taurine catabolism dioxygenase TauD, TfdA family [Chitinophaga costaii]|uniref:Taurine catabolism dioxygenase TauD, TfdA family n=1 Tax=Chitinophaga costaii TaxID=1335309 RepID=A0A1C3YT86_9BACT|nr:TauD/TfdA family dioxygenase [Chitinophaga costaii]PUZ30097.1 taurine catabolism dioxygenase TauD [Chitinophaga costaii]SCB73311.1 Taurine catabolism dioxygenase TauD, TfdA family [Chitinophaga costaii]